MSLRSNSDMDMPVASDSRSSRRFCSSVREICVLIMM